MAFALVLTGDFLGFNDDFCGSQSSVTFVANGNSVRVLINKYTCDNESSCMTLRMTRLTEVDPCDSAVTLMSDSVGSFNLDGAGVWDNLGGPFSTAGQEAVYQFTATVSGTHTVRPAHPARCCNGSGRPLSPFRARPFSHRPF